MTALAQLAAYDTLDAQTIDRLLAQHLVDTFTAHAIPDEPIELELVVDEAGASLSWRDPGAQTFHAAAEFHWSVVELAADGTPQREVAAGVSYAPSTRIAFALDPSHQIRVCAVNECPGNERLASATSYLAVDVRAEQR